MKIKTFIKNNWILLIILVIGLFMRVFNARELFYYSHDNDLAGWFVRDVVVNKHLRLIGQETSTQGIFIGPIYYYLLIPFYLMFNMDPFGGVVLITILGMLSILSIYFVFKEIFDTKVGLIASFIYSISFYTVFNDREVVPTMPVIAWSVWFLYAVNKILKGDQKIGYVIAGILLGLIWHLNMTLILLIPLLFLAQYMSGKKIKKTNLKGFFTPIFILTLPLILFEVRHGFSQVKWFYRSMTTDQYAIVVGYEKFVQVIHLNAKNITGLVWGNLVSVNYELLFYVFLIIFFFLIIQKVIPKKLSIILLVWISVYFTFFTVYSKNVSEYYLNGLIVIWLLVLSLFFYALLKTKIYVFCGVILIAIFSMINIYRFFKIPINRSGYLYRRAIVAEIKNNANIHRYPCVSISYITKPGYNLGYRYLFFLENMHVNTPKSGSPVYTIVYPLREDISVNVTNGSIGLIYPDYEQYNMDDVSKSCTGDNANTTEPMWGFTN